METRSAPRDTVGAFRSLLEELEFQRASDVAGRLARAAELEQLAEQVGDVMSTMRARLVRADMLQRSGELAEGFHLASEINAWADSVGATDVLARSHLVLSAVFSGAGDAASALDHAVRGTDRLPTDSPSRERGNHLMALADALALVGAADEARGRYAEAQRVFAAIGDRERELTALNNLVVLECEIGDHEAAHRAAERLAILAVEHGEMNSSFAETIARARLAVDDLAGAAAAVHEGLRLLAEQGDSQATTPAELQLAHAEVSMALGRFDDAERSLERCEEIAATRGLAWFSVEVLRAKSELLAARGEHRPAYEAYREYHAAERALHSRQRENDARTRHALYETAEARREAERFWRQARTDALTELPNRRFVDERLPAVLEIREARQRLVVAIVDVDRFKAINDTFGHALGDEVLQRLGVLLGDSVVGGDPADFAARLGGEEFLVVHLVDDLAAAVDQIEQLRARVAAEPWHELAPGLKVTISAGLAVAGPTDSMESLFGRADELLYRAKAGGRDRVEAPADISSSQ